MQPPLPKHELVLARCPNERAIDVSIASLEALEWVKLNLCYMDDISGLMLERRRIPIRTTLSVNPCYDVGEVIAFLNNKPWSTINHSIHPGA